MRWTWWRAITDRPCPHPAAIRGARTWSARTSPPRTRDYRILLAVSEDATQVKKPVCRMRKEEQEEEEEEEEEKREQ